MATPEEELLEWDGYSGERIVRVGKISGVRIVRVGRLLGGIIFSVGRLLRRENC